MPAYIIIEGSQVLVPLHWTLERVKHVSNDPLSQLTGLIHFLLDNVHIAYADISLLEYLVFDLHDLLLNKGVVDFQLVWVVTKVFRELL